MPSGAKKRKAAKKKKEVESSFKNSISLPSNAHSRDGSSPASHELHSHQPYFTGDEKEKVEHKRDILNPPSMDGLNNEGTEKQKIKIGENEKSIILLRRELKQENELDKDVKIEYDEPSRKSYEGSMSASTSSSRSSSDNESHDIEVNGNVIDDVSLVDSATPADLLSERHEDEIHAVPIKKGGVSISGTPPVFGLEKILMVDDKPQVDQNDTTDNSMTSYLIESSLKENGVKKSSHVGEKIVISASTVDVLSQEEDESTVQVIEVVPGAKEAKVNHEKLMPKCGEPRVDANNVVECEKDHKFSEPLVAPGLRPVQTTSWKSCCGLFAVFTGSGR